MSVNNSFSILSSYETHKSFREQNVWFLIITVDGVFIILHFVDRASYNDSWWMINVMHKFSSMCLFIFTTLYMFRTHSAHHQERQIFSIQPLVTVILCWWPRCVQVGRSLLTTCTHLGTQHRMTVTRGCIDTICLSWWWTRGARKHVESYKLK